MFTILVITMIKSYLFSVLITLFASTAYGKTPHDAARDGDLDTLRQYRFESNDLFLPDKRGFIPYELAALWANPEDEESLRQHVEVMLWLKEFKAEKHYYGEASIQLIQAGLNALGYPVGKPDGNLGNKTSKAIREYQEENDLAETGKPGPQWLGLFYHDLIKDMQFKLTKLGFDTRGTDGLMGPKTRAAILDYRKKNKLSDPDYAYLDSLIVGNIDYHYNKRNSREQKAKAEKERRAKSNKIRFAQAGLRLQGYRIGRIDGVIGPRTIDALKKFQKKNRLPVTGDIDSKTQGKMDVVFLKDVQKKLARLGYRVGKADGKMGKRTLKALSSYSKKHRLSARQLTPDLMVSLNRSFNQKIERDLSNAEKAQARAEAKARAAAAKAKKAAEAKSAAKALAKKKPHTGKKTQVKSKTSSPQSSSYTLSEERAKEAARVKALTLAAQQAEAERKAQARAAKIARENAKKLAAARKKAQRQEKSYKNKRVVRGGKAKGRMNFNRSGGRVVGCSIAGRNIPIEWCEPFYPLPRNNHCEATFKSSSGAVINLWCK
ncbi:MAG: hypothetical protein CSA45_00695 [Gammaproteobacteria bacterium]|nr:MAG: hypothetical protein CSA45_00695 [Gammaproteobacteria bacterium]